MSLVEAMALLVHPNQAKHREGNSPSSRRLGDDIRYSFPAHPSPNGQPETANDNSGQHCSPGSCEPTLGCLTNIGLSVEHQWRAQVYKFSCGTRDYKFGHFVDNPQSDALS